MLVQRLAIDPRQVLVRLAIGPREQPGNLSWVVRQLQDLRRDPVGLDQGDVVQQRADAVERSVGIPINHLRADAVELTQGVAAAVFEGGQPTADLGIVRYRLESQSLLNRGRQSPKSFSDTSEPSRAWVRQTPI